MCQYYEMKDIIFAVDIETGGQIIYCCFVYMFQRVYKIVRLISKYP
jgi:hypothetical protein